MAVYRIKRFTRAEKEAWKEVYRNLVHGDLFKGDKRNYFFINNTKNPRDLFRAQKLAIDLHGLSEGNKKGFDIQNARTLLTNAGMPKMAGQVEKLVDKYTNKRALVRLKRLKDRGEFFDKSDYSFDKLINRGSQQFNKGESIMNDYQKYLPRKSKEMDKLIRYSQNKLKVPVKFEYNPSELNPNQSYMIGYSLNDRNNRTVGEILGGRVVLGKNANEGILAHELGHARAYEGPYGSDLKRVSTVFSPLSPFRRMTSDGKVFLKQKNTTFRTAADQFAAYINEKSANHYGHSILKKAKVDPDIINKSFIGRLGNELNYAGAAIEDIARKGRAGNYDLKNPNI